MLRLLRQRSERQTVKAGRAVASVSLAELQVAFGGMSINQNRDTLAKLLREE